MSGSWGPTRNVKARVYIISVIEGSLESFPKLPSQADVSPAEPKFCSIFLLFLSCGAHSLKSLTCPKHAQESGWNHSNSLQVSNSHNPFFCIPSSLSRNWEFLLALQGSQQ
jgi:hypothetical protein